MEENNKSAPDNWKILSSVDLLFRRTFALSKVIKNIMNKKEQQNDAKRFSLEYLQYLLRQEDIIERLLDKRMIQLEPELEKLIDEKIDSRIRTYLNK